MNGWTFPADLAAVREAINPRDVILFHGNINLDKLNFGEKMMIQSVKATVGDYRDWLVIRTWASMINLES
ncbi:MAG: hypothetical protein HC875_07150 [Anaerolineales bacterium]|nr:hypothetical protein [Anaerolineales bacterium]